MDHLETNRRKVIIIGAGAAGLGAAQYLVKNGLTDIAILEGNNRIGGRVHTVPFGSHAENIIELGANWIHGGTIANPMFTLGMQHGLIEKDGEIPYLERFEEIDDCCFTKSNGKIVDLECSQRAIRAFFEVEKAAFMLFFQNSPAIGTDANLGDYFKDELSRKVSEEFRLEEQHDVKCVFNSLINYLKFHVSDQLEKLSLKQYGTFQEIPGDDVIIPGGFQSLLETVVKDLPTDTIRFNQHVLKINWSDSNRSMGKQESPVRLICQDGTSWQADHAIVTVSIGYLKKHHKTLFHPLLPRYKTDAIENIGFGCTNKIFLQFERPFWKYGNTKYIGIAWSDEELADATGDNWEKSIYGFEEVYDNPNVLSAWIAGRGSEMMESLPADTVMEACVKILRQFTGNDTIPTPKGICRTTWHTDCFALGSYSYASTHSGIPEIKRLALPLPSAGQPSLLFAGEATHPCYYSTVHGAFQTGIRAAKQILQTSQSKL